MIALNASNVKTGRVEIDVIRKHPVLYVKRFAK